MKNRLYKSLLCFLSLTILISLTACQKEAVVQNDILTQKETESGRTQITVLVKYAFSINAFEKAVEEKFKDIDIVQVGNYTSDRGINEYAARMEHDDLTDIVMTWPVDAGSEYCKDRLLDLSGMSFTSNYNTSMLNTISQDGELYYLPGPSQIRGIVYNKTLFKEKGWQVPTDYENFVKLCQTIEKSGMRSLQLGFENSEVLDTAFDGYGYSDCFSKPKDTEWINNYNETQTGSFGDHFGKAIDIFQEMIDAGIWKKSDLNVDYSDREKMFFNRECAMIEDSVLLARMGEEYNGCTDEFGLMPFFNKGKDASWARLYMVSYIGLNKHLAEEKNKEKYDLVMKLMDYVSTTEGQSALSADTGAMYSSVKGATLLDVPEIKDLVTTLNSGRYAIFPELKNAQTALRTGLSDLLYGKINKQQLIESVDQANKSPSQNQSAEVLGKVTDNFTLIETGNFVCDALKESSGCELALFLDNGKDGLFNGKGISAKLYQGDITMNDIDRIMPDLKSGDKGQLWKVTMSGEKLVQTLENSISIENGKTGWFYYFSGLKVEMNPTAALGKRIKSVTLADGSELDLKKNYSIAIMGDSVNNDYFVTCEKTSTTVKDIFIDAVKSGKEILPANDKRFIIID